MLRFGSRNKGASQDPEMPIRVIPAIRKRLGKTGLFFLHWHQRKRWNPILNEIYRFNRHNHTNIGFERPETGPEERSQLAKERTEFDLEIQYRQDLETGIIYGVGDEKVPSILCIAKALFYQGFFRPDPWTPEEAFSRASHILNPKALGTHIRVRRTR